ncbi:MAG: [NiFe]-hydrogenase assembly chaperone HybE [Gammaproteobacteria bacterium]|nr:[NiFe]-hydrogenase assembly chaperone HybE [Gammaproteobacteria bacterium]
MPAPDPRLPAPGARLVRHFDEVARTRMVDVPIVNPALTVEAVGFAPTDAGWIGILITPWFMNLVLLPAGDDDWLGLPIGSTVSRTFASGGYTFQVAGDADSGRYLTCPLMSPLLEIPDQQTAVAVAHAALAALHDAAQHDTGSSTHAAEVARRWHGAPDGRESDTAVDAAPQPAATTLLSRRAFLAGGLFDSDRNGA